MLDRTHTSFLAIGLTVFASFFGCAKKDQPVSEDGQRDAPVAAAAPAEAPPDHAAAARAVFKTRCAVCHGDSGKGDGPGAAALNPKPRDYADPEWQKSVTDEEIQRAIVYGGAAVGKSPIMPGSPDLKQTPEVVSELTKMVRAFAK